MKKLFTLSAIFLSLETVAFILFPFGVRFRNGLVLFSMVLIAVCFGLAFYLVKEASSEISRSAQEQSGPLEQSLLEMRSKSLDAERQELLDLLEQSQTATSALELPAESHKRWCAHPLTDAILYHKIPELEKKGISCSVSIRLPKEMPVQDSDWLAVLMNMIDNAGDAASQSQINQVKIDLYTKGHFVICRTENASSPDPNIQPKSGRTHGLGLTILKDICSRNGGSFYQDRQPDHWISMASLSLEEQS